MYFYKRSDGNYQSSLEPLNSEELEEIDEKVFEHVIENLHLDNTDEMVDEKDLRIAELEAENKALSSQINSLKKGMLIK